MSKPIFIIRFPYSKEHREEYIEVLESIRKTMHDYHVFSVMDSKTERVEFECYNADNASELNIEKIKTHFVNLESKL